MGDQVKPGNMETDDGDVKVDDSSMDVGASRKRGASSSSGLNGQDDGRRSTSLGMDVTGDDDRARAEKRSRDEENDDMKNEVEVMEINDEVINMDSSLMDEELEPEGLGPKMVEDGCREEANCMVKVMGMFEFGSYEDAIFRSNGKAPVTTKWVKVKKVGEDGKEFARCRLVGRDFKPRHEAPRDDLCVSMPPLEANKVFFSMVAGCRGRRRRAGKPEIRLMFVDVKKAHLTARCHEDARVEFPWICGMGEVRTATALALWHAQGGIRIGRILFHALRG